MKKMTEKRIKFWLLAALTAVSAAWLLTGCGKRGDGGNRASGQESGAGDSDMNGNGENPGGAGGSGGADAGQDQDADYGTGRITVWVAENVSAFTQQQIAAFQEDHPQFAGYTVSVEPVGESDAANNMITDVEGGADLYGFAQDQLARLVSAGALMPIPGDYALFIREQNDAGASAAASMGDLVFAFPLTSDNGYFLFYDSSVISDPTSLEAIVQDCERSGKGFYMEINSGWYQTAFFFGTGCTLTYEADDTGKFTGCNVDYASEKGLAALKTLIALHKSPAFYNGSSVSKAANAAAIAAGTWDIQDAKKAFGENYACTMLPTFTTGGKTYQMSGFGGFKLLGVKPQTDVKKMQACLELARYLSGEEVQLARYRAAGWGPSNLATQQSEEVRADEALSALADQLAVSVPQGQYPNEYWTLATSLGDSIISGAYDEYTDEQLMGVLQDFQEACISYAR